MDDKLALVVRVVCNVRVFGHDEHAAREKALTVVREETGTLVHAAIAGVEAIDVDEFYIDEISAEHGYDAVVLYDGETAVVREPELIGVADTGVTGAYTAEIELRVVRDVAANLTTEQADSIGKSMRLEGGFGAPAHHIMTAALADALAGTAIEDECIVEHKSLFLPRSVVHS